MNRASSESLQSAVYSSLRASISDGRLPAGQRFFENDIAARLGVSRTPVRAVLRSLEAQGLVAFTEGRRGFEVVDPAEDIAVVYEIRQRLEGLAARLAAQYISEPELQALRRVQQRMVEIVDDDHIGASCDELAELNAKFHALVNGACRRPRLNKFIEQLSPIYISRRVVTFYTSAELRNSLAEHDAILGALWNRDGDRAERLTHQHLLGGQKYLLKGVAGAHRRGL